MKNYNLTIWQWLSVILLTAFMCSCQPKTHIEINGIWYDIVDICEQETTCEKEDYYLQYQSDGVFIPHYETVVITQCVKYRTDTIKSPIQNK